MKHVVLLATGAALLTLGACQREVRIEKTFDHEDGVMRTISKLDCPENQGELKRISAAPDGLTCAYAADGAEVTLRLVSLANGDAKAALDPIEAELKGLIPPPSKDGKAVAEADAKATVADDTSSHEGKAEIDFPGLHIKADDSGAKIRVGGIKVDANDDGAEVRVGEATTVNANDNGAEIRNNHAGEGVRATYILASDKIPAGGYEVVGYEARGPKAGPIVVAVVKAREGQHQHDLFDDMKELVERNVGD